MTEPKTMTVQVAGKTLHFETGRLAQQAHGSCLLRIEETMVFASACATATPSSQADFLGLKVDYQENFSSAGKTISGFIKREGRPSEKEILTSRLIDRPLRPLFPDGYFNEVQLLSYVWSYDGKNSPEPLAICATAAALLLSDIPFTKAVAAVRVGYIEGQFLINPSVAEQEKSELDLLLAGTHDAILMIEGYCNFLTEEQVLEAIEQGHAAIKVICDAIQGWSKEIGKKKKEAKLLLPSEELKTQVEQFLAPHLDKILRIPQKEAREVAIDGLEEALYDYVNPDQDKPNFDQKLIKGCFKQFQSHKMRQMILDEKVRVDGRRYDQVRPIWIEQHMLPRSHGSSLFTRGETQALAICTLGGENMAQRFESLDGESSRRFYLQYFFPPFSVGEVGRMGPAGRREVGHGKLAERALQNSIPSKQAFPYTIRLESRILACNGSSSMATVCAGCLALMDAGVPIERPVSGIAMGLILGEEGRHAILSDILGIEDALGDMDFKITGDAKGITAFQMDIKVEGITAALMRTALMQAKQGRIHILEKMLAACPHSRKEMSAYAPRIEVIPIRPSKIGVVIGPGGKQIRAIVEETGVEIDIDDAGFIHLSSNSLEAIEKAKKIIHGLTAEVEIGQIYEGKVSGIAAFGLFVELLPGKEGLCHISEYDPENRSPELNKLEKIGNPITVKVTEINERGQVKVSRKALMNRPARG